MLSVQFRNLLPSEDLLLFARSLWEGAQREGLGPVQARDAMLSITRTDGKVAAYEASLQLDHGTLQSTATEADPLGAIEAAFAQLDLARARRNRALARITPAPRLLLRSLRHRAGLRELSRG